MGESVHRSLRIDKEVDERVIKLKLDDENVTQAYTRLVSIGCDFLENGVAVHTAPDSLPSGATSGEVEAYRATIAALRETNAFLMQQLTVKDEQIRTSSRLLESGFASQAAPVREPDASSVYERVKRDMDERFDELADKVKAKVDGQAGDSPRSVEAVVVDDERDRVNDHAAEKVVEPPKKKGFFARLFE